MAEINNRVNIRPNNLKNVLIWLFWFGLIFCTSKNTSGNWDFGLHIIYQPFRYFFIVNPDHKFPGFEFLIILMSLYFISKYKPSFKNSNGYIRFYFVATFLFILLAFINPNNYMDDGLISFFSFKVTRTLLFLLLFSFSFLFIPISKFHNLFLVFFKTGTKVVLAKAIFDLFAYTIGMGVANDFGRRITTLGLDTQVWFSIFHIIFVVLFFYTRKNKYLLYALLLFINLALSYQRTSTFTVMLFDFFLFIYFSVFYKKYLIIRFSSILIVLIIFATLIVVIVKTNFGQDIFYRMMAVTEFTGYFKEESNKAEYTDSGHLLQSESVTMYLQKNYSKFWGGGISRRGEDYLFIEGQSNGGVHCNIVSMWQYFGLPGIMYLLSLFMFFLITLIRIISTKKHYNFNELIIFSITLYFVLRLIIGWFSGDFFFVYIQSAIQYVFLFAFYKFKNTSYFIIP